MESRHFKNWVNWAKKQELGLDFNSTLFSHPMAEDGLHYLIPIKKLEITGSDIQSQAVRLQPILGKN